MPKFTFTAIDSSGKERTGLVDAPSRELASSQVKSMGLIPMDLTVDEGPVATRARKRAVAAAGVKSKKPMTVGSVVSKKGLTVFTRQLATLTQAGLPLLRGLEVLARQEKNPAFKWVIEQLGENIRTGNTFSEGLQAHPRVFSRLYVNMVRAGEAGGVLDVVLNRLARFMEKAERIKGKIRSAMIYPIIIMFVTTVVLWGLMSFVVPKFEAIYREQLKGASLPFLTREVLGVSRMIKDHFLLALLGIAIVVVAFVLLRQTRQGTYAIDWLKLNVPRLGELIRKTAIASFARTLGTLLASGVPILQALQITRDTSGNIILVDAIDYVHDRVKEGESVALPLEQTKVFPGMVTSMVDVGEETGELPDMLNRIADTYDEEVDYAVASFTAIIEPIMIVALALVVGTVVIALFLPIKDIIDKIQMQG